MERLDKGLEQLVRVVNTVCILTDDPDHGSLSLWLVQRVQVLAQGGNDGLIAVGVLAEDVLDHDHSLLHHVVDLGVDQLQQHIDAALRCTLNLDRTPPNRSDASPHELHVHLRRILLELKQHLLNVALRGQQDHDLQLLHLDVDGVIVLAEEDLDLVRQDGGALLHNQTDVAQRHILDLRRRRRQQRHQRRCQLALQGADHVLVVDHVHVTQDHLDRGQHHRTVRMLQPRRHALHDALRLARVRRGVRGQ
mmetsp:Transcript_12057/g.38535  ORF Transcript_12057/g.38535 Transcript_12057/m.38535 type:complete len:250 (-) Transcript_12057:738-1487(-)